MAVEASESSPAMRLYLESIESPATRYQYRYNVARFFAAVGLGPDAFVEKAKADPRWAEDRITEFILGFKRRAEAGEIGRDYIKNPFQAVKAFCEAAPDFPPLAWKRMKKFLPRGASVADDRGAEPREIRPLAMSSDYRIQVATRASATCGVRVGAWDYLLLRHVTPIYRKNGGFDFGTWRDLTPDGRAWREEPVAGKLEIYAGTPDRYYTYAGPGSLAAIRDYLKHRAENGEALAPGSPLLRNLYSPGEAGENVKPLKSSGLSNMINAHLLKLHLKTPREGADGKKRLRTRYEFSRTHGFRKHAKTAMERAGMRSLHVEMVIGHGVGLAGAYYRPSENEVLVDFLKALPALEVWDPRAPAEAAEQVKALEERVQQMEAERASTKAILGDIRDILADPKRAEALSELLKAAKKKVA